MLGENIRRIRTDRNMTQSALAAKSGVSVQQISMIECGRKGLSVPSLLLIAQALNCSTDEILKDVKVHNG